MKLLLIIAAFTAGVYMGVHFEEENHALHISKAARVPYWQVVYRVAKIEGLNIRISRGRK